jgi:hypothetical protein
VKSVAFFLCLCFCPSWLAWRLAANHPASTSRSASISVFALLPPALQNANPMKIERVVNGRRTSDPIT